MPCTAEHDQFVVLIRDFPVSVDDEDARMLAHLIWSSELARHGGTPVSEEADLDIQERMDGDILAVRVLGLADRLDDLIRSFVRTLATERTKLRIKDWSPDG
jgi:hypothetical protein